MWGASVRGSLPGIRFMCLGLLSSRRSHSALPVEPGNQTTAYIDRYRYYADGPGQMQHFVNAYGFNVFRPPVAWQYLVNHKVGGSLDESNLALYDLLVQACLRSGAHCILDIHNYGRWNGKIVGQGGPSNEQFASVWRQLAQKYENERRIMFGIMNEPHNRKTVDQPMATWQNANISSSVDMEI